MYVVAAPERAQLAQDVAQRIDADLLTYETKTFPDGERFVRIDASIEGAAVLLADARPNERVIDTLIACDSAREAGADTIHLAVPYLSYARQDTAFEPGEGVSARAVNRALGTGADTLATVDVHAAHVLEYFPGPAVSEQAAPELATALDERGLELVLAPDRGARELAASIGDRLGVPHDYLEKTRRSSTEVEMAPKALDVTGRTVAIVDDIIATGGTMATASEHLLEQGAAVVLVAATHGLFVAGADKRLEDAGVEEILVTDAIPTERSSVSCADALARGLQRTTAG